MAGGLLAADILDVGPHNPNFPPVCVVDELLEAQLHRECCGRPSWPPLCIAAPSMSWAALSLSMFVHLPMCVLGSDKSSPVVVCRKKLRAWKSKI